MGSGRSGVVSQLFIFKKDNSNSFEKKYLSSLISKQR